MTEAPDRYYETTHCSGGTMHDLSRCDSTTTPQRLLKGIAFEIPDLVLIKSWADARTLRMVVRLDYATDSEEYEEVIALYPESSSTSPLIMWRTEKFVCVLPVIGARRWYRTVANTLESPIMNKIPSTVLTNIVVQKAY
jgi:hypothetical protein